MMWKGWPVLPAVLVADGDILIETPVPHIIRVFRIFAGVGYKDLDAYRWSDTGNSIGQGPILIICDYSTW